MNQTVTKKELADAIGEQVTAAVVAGLKEVLPALGAAGKDGVVPNPGAVLAAPPSQHRKRDHGGRVTGAYFGLLGKCSNSRPAMLHYAKELYGEDAPVVKALTSQAPGAGDELVPVTVAREIIEALRPVSVVRQMSPTIVENPTGSLEIPRFDDSVALSWTEENTGVNATQPGTDKVTLLWRKGIIKVPYTQELLLHSAPDVEAAIEADVLRAAGVGTDLAYLRGATGGSNPVGILNQVTPGTQLLDANATVTPDNVEDDLRRVMESVIGKNVMLEPSTGYWVMSSRVYLFLMNLRDANGLRIYPELRQATPTLLTYRVMITNNIPNNLGGGTESEIYFGRGPSLLIADATNMSSEVLRNVAYLNSGGNLVSGVDDDTTLIKLTLRTDIALRHPVAWAVLRAVLWGA